MLSSPTPFRLRLVPGEAPHLAIQDHAQPDPDLPDPLEARIVERLEGASRPLPALHLRDALRVRKADLLSALRALATRGLVSKTDDGWTLASSAD